MTINYILDIPGLQRLAISADDPAADDLASRCASLAGLGQSGPAAGEILITRRASRLRGLEPSYLLGPLRFARSGRKTICLCDSDGGTNMDETAVTIFLILALRLQEAGALLLHGALAEKNGRGVLLAAPSGTGKSTASRRLAAPWRALCDDTTVIVGDGAGGYRCHPWPTMGEIREGRARDSWEVARGIPLDGIFLLEQAPESGRRDLGDGEALCSLVHIERQASWLMDCTLGEEGMRQRRLGRFERLAGLAAAVPSFRLRLTLDNPFWNDIEEALAAASESLPAGAVQ